MSLTTREHLIVHIVLMKAFIKRYGKLNLKTAQMSMAVHKMVYRLQQTLKCRITSRHYAIARKAVILSKLGKDRPDMKGKKFFGATEEAISNGLLKMANKKRGVKTNYPKNRKRRIQTSEINSKISASRLKTLEKYKKMTKEEFKIWLSNKKLFMTDGRVNSNITRAISARNEDINDYYSKL